MDETARRRARARKAARASGNADRRNAAAALQRALDRRDNGGATDGRVAAVRLGDIDH